MSILSIGRWNDHKAFRGIVDSLCAKLRAARNDARTKEEMVNAYQKIAFDFLNETLHSARERGIKSTDAVAMAVSAVVHSIALEHDITTFRENDAKD